MKIMFAQSLVIFSIFYVLSVVLTLSCSDWFLVWMGLEINMIGFIVIIYDRSSSSVEVSLKYFFIQSIGSGILMMMFYFPYSWFDLLSLGVLSYKMGGGPFYFWFPSVCESLSWGSCLLLMTVQKILPLVLISFLVSVFLWFIIMVSLIIGAVGSFNQKSLKRLMAFSSVHHIGWILMGNFMEDSLWMVYLVLYSVMLISVVWVLWKDNICEVSALKNMSSKWSFILGMLNMGGVPPMLGFYLKWWLFYNLMKMDFSLLILMIGLSVLMLYVYLRVSYMSLMGSSSIFSWGVFVENKSYLSMDLFYMMGLNVMVMIWLIMM